MSGGAAGPHCRGGLEITLGGVPSAGLTTWAQASVGAIALTPATKPRRVIPFAIAFSVFFPGTFYPVFWDRTPSAALVHTEDCESNVTSILLLVLNAPNSPQLSSRT